MDEDKEQETRGEKKKKKLEGKSCKVTWALLEMDHLPPRKTTSFFCLGKII